MSEAPTWIMVGEQYHGVNDQINAIHTSLLSLHSHHSPMGKKNPMGIKVLLFFHGEN